MLMRYYAGLIRQLPQIELRDGLLGGQIQLERMPIIGKELGPEGLAAYQKVQTVYVKPPTLI